ncbi:MAG: hypothetical protein RL072_660 [Actinomycetota bacterium]
MGIAESGSVRAGVNSAAFIDGAGRLRMIFEGGSPSDRKWSTISSDGGATWAVDTSFSWPTDLQSSFGHISVVAAPDGGYRGFVRNETGITSVYSSNGQTWTKESGVRLAPSAFGLEKLDGGGVAKLPDGRYRMYVGDESSYFRRCGSDKSVSVKIYSATSSDQLTWTVDAGYRIGPELGTRCNLHPHAFVDPNGAVGIIFHVNNDIEKSNSEWQSSCHYALSTDGLTFSAPKRIPATMKKTSYGTENMADDCDLMVMPDKTLRLFASLFGPGPDGNQIFMSTGTAATKSSTSTVAPSSGGAGTPAKSTKITCVKGKVTKVVSGNPPKCPAGFKKK